jgi:hypothetical protein
VPAILLARLRQQTALLAGQFGHPSAFLRSLEDLLELYADRTQRPGQAGAPPPLIKTYRVPAPVLRQLKADLAPLADEQPRQALKLADLLWEQPFLEPRLLAVALLGSVPPIDPDLILETALSWCRSGAEERILSAILTDGLKRLRQEKPDWLVEHLEGWLTEGDLPTQQLGLRALLSLLEDPGFNNLPVCYRLLTPYVRSTPPALRPDLRDLLEHLARRSPPETAFFLRQNLDVPENQFAAWLTRQCLHAFPEENRASLRAALRGA